MKLKIGKRSGLRYFGIHDIRAWSPCYDFIPIFPPNWIYRTRLYRQGTVDLRGEPKAK